MANPVIPWELRSFDDESDPARLSANLQALVDYITFEVIHTHHVETQRKSISGLASGASEDLSVTWNQTFTTEPHTQVSVMSLISPVPAGSGRIVVQTWGVTTTGCNIRVQNNASGALTADQHLAVVTAIDATYDTSGV